MLKAAATLLLLFGGAGIGYARSRELTEREKNLEILLQILFFLKGEIRCGNSTLPDAFREIAGKVCGTFAEILQDAAKEMENNNGKSLEEIMETSIYRMFSQPDLERKFRNSREEMEILRTLGKRLGYLDREMQLRQIELLETEVEDRRKRFKEKLPEQKKISQTLGILGGILLAVLFW